MVSAMEMRNAMRVPSRATMGVNFRPVTSRAIAPPTSPSSALKSAEKNRSFVVWIILIASGNRLSVRDCEGSR